MLYEEYLTENYTTIEEYNKLNKIVDELFD